MNRYGDPFSNPLGHPGGPPDRPMEYEERWVTDPHSFERKLIRTPKFGSSAQADYEAMKRWQKEKEADKRGRPQYSAKKDKPNKILLLEDI